MLRIFACPLHPRHPSPAQLVTLGYASPSISRLLSYRLDTRYPDFLDGWHVMHDGQAGAAVYVAFDLGCLALYVTQQLSALFPCSRVRSMYLDAWCYIYAFNFGSWVLRHRCMLQPVRAVSRKSLQQPQLRGSDPVNSARFVSGVAFNHSCTLVVALLKHPLNRSVRCHPSDLDGWW